MLATKHSPRSRAASIRLTCPACRLPMVGTKATRRPSRCQPRTRSRTAAMVVTVCIATGSCVPPPGFEVVGRAVHEVAYEAWLAPGRDIEHVVGHENLSVGIRTCADADDRHVQRGGDLFAQAGGDALQQHDIRARRLQLARLLEQPRRRVALA